MAGDGVWVASDELRGHFPPFPVDAVATVAAGDAFAGVLGRALCERNDLENAIQLAMAAGALCVSRPGTHPLCVREASWRCVVINDRDQ